MKDRKLLGTGFGSQLTGLPGGEMELFLGHGAVFVQKSSFDKKVVGILGEFNDFLFIGITVSHIANVGNFFTRRNQRNFLGEFSELELFFLALTFDFSFKIRIRINLAIQGLLESRQPGAGFKSQSIEALSHNIDMKSS